MIVEVTAKFACDHCGTEFLVRLDPGYDPPDDWTVFDVAVDAVRSGLWYEDATDDRPKGSGSVDEERHYCARCTKQRDDKGTGSIVVDGRYCYFVDFGGYWRTLDRPFQHGGQWLWGDGKWHASLEGSDSQAVPAKWPTEAAARAFAASKST